MLGLVAKGVAFHFRLLPSACVRKIKQLSNLQIGLHLDVFSLFHKNMQNKKSTRIKNNKGKTEKQEQKKEKN